jgi:hypothetical protein
MRSINIFLWYSQNFSVLWRVYTQCQIIIMSLPLFKVWPHLTFNFIDPKSVILVLYILHLRFSLVYCCVLARCRDEEPMRHSSTCLVSFVAHVHGGSSKHFYNKPNWQSDLLRTILATFSTFSGVFAVEGRPDFGSFPTFFLPSINFLNHSKTCVRDRHWSPYTSVNKL